MMGSMMNHHYGYGYGPGYIPPYYAGGYGYNAITSSAAMA